MTESNRYATRPPSFFEENKASKIIFWYQSVLSFHFQHANGSIKFDVLPSILHGNTSLACYFPKHMNKLRKEFSLNPYADKSSLGVYTNLLFLLSLSLCVGNNVPYKVVCFAIPVRDLSSLEFWVSNAWILFAIDAVVVIMLVSGSSHHWKRWHPGTKTPSNCTLFM